MDPLRTLRLFAGACAFGHVCACVRMRKQFQGVFTGSDRVFARL